MLVMSKRTISAGLLGTLRQFTCTLLLGANISLLIILWSCCLTTRVPADAHGHISVLGLAFPVVLLLNIFFVPLWLALRWRYVVIPLLGITLVAGYVLDYFPLSPITRDTQTDSLRIVSWNVKGFSVVGDQMERLVSEFCSWDADIVCIQEFVDNPNAQRLSAAADSIGYTRIVSAERCVFTRLPVLDTLTLDMPTALSNGAICVDLAYGGDTIKLFNLHLESNFIDKKDRTDGLEAFDSGQKRKFLLKMWKLWDKLAISTRTRAQQVHVLTHLLDSMPVQQRVILCGDFNDIPISYSYQQINRYLLNAYRQVGNGIGISYNDPLFPVRIDHLFHTPHWYAQRVWIEDHCKYSDHNPLHVVLKAN